MPSPDPTTVLLVSDNAQDIKLITISLRGFYPGCRVEAVYSAQEAAQWASKAEWHVILLDEEIPPQGYAEVIPELRRRAANAAIIVLSEHADASASAQVTRIGGDACLFKKSSGFLAELMVVIREILEKRELRLRMDLTQSRYLRLVEIIPDLVYELDTEGRFSFISPSVLALLGYRPEELLGTHYSTLVYPSDCQKAERVMNERRTGARATKTTPLRLSPKAKTLEGQQVITVEIHAKGLYDRRNQFVGTIGIARDLTKQRQSADRLQQLEARAEQADQLLGLRHHTAKIAEELSTPLSSLLVDTARLLKKAEELRLEHHLQEVLAHILRAAQLGKELTTSTLAHKVLLLPVSINELLEEALSIKAPDLDKQGVSVERHVETILPPVLGDSAQLRHLFVILLGKAEQAVRDSARRKRLLLSAQRVSGEAGLTDSVRIQITDEGWAVRMAEREPLSYDAEDEEWAQADDIVKQHGGALDVAPSSLGGLYIQTWLPISGEGIQGASPPSTRSAEPPERQVPSPTPTAEGLEPPHARETPGETALAERRQSSRSCVQLDARLTHEGTTWTGKVVNIGLTGLSMEIEGFVPAMANQSLHVGLVTAAAVLQLQGAVRGVREVDRRRIGPKYFPATALSVEFTTVTHDEQLVLASLLDSIREQSISVSCTALLEPAKPEDILVEVRAAADGGLQHIPLESFALESEPFEVVEHRFAARANYVAPATLELLDGGGVLHRYRGSTLNLSRCGACLRLEASPDLPGLRSNLVLTVSEAQEEHGTGVQPESAEIQIRTEVAWITPDQSTPGQRQGASSPGKHRVGLRFLHIDEAQERCVARLVAKLLTSPLRLEGFQPGSELVSTFMECRNKMGRRVALFYDRPRKPLAPGSPVVIISPGFGETKRQYIPLAYGLALNGFHVLRYDHTNHVGESQGEMAESTLSGMKEDLLTIRRFTEHTWPASPIVFLAVGLAARVALRAVAEEANVNLLVLLTCVVDIGSTLQSVQGQDLVAAHRARALKETTNVLGWNVNTPNWLGDVVGEGYADLDSTVKDAERIRVPTITVAVERDPTVLSTSIQMVQRALGSVLRHQYVLPGSYRLREDPRKDRLLYRQLITACREQCYPMAVRERIRAPSSREISQQSLLEWERLLARHGGPIPQRVEIWSQDAPPPRPTRESSEYWLFLHDIARLMGQPQAGERILEVPCGNSHFAEVLMINQAYRQLHAGMKETGSVCYVGLDTPCSIVSTAKETFSGIADSLSTSPPKIEPHGAMRALFAVSELHRPLPFRDDSFDRIVCNLAIGSVPDPVSSVRELGRILKPGGRLALSCLRKYEDLTQHYRSMVGTITNLEGRALLDEALNRVGVLLEKQHNGLLRCFDVQELMALLSCGRMTRPRGYHTFSRQACIAIGEKEP